MEKVLVAYFSASGTTAQKAKEIAKESEVIFMKSDRKYLTQAMIWIG